MKSSSVQLLQSVVEPLLDNIFVRPPTDHYMTKKNAQLKTFIEPLPPKPKTLTPKAFVPEMSKSFASTLWHYRWVPSYTNFAFCDKFPQQEMCKRGPTHGPCLEMRRGKPLADVDIILHIWEVVLTAQHRGPPSDHHPSMMTPWIFCSSLHNLVSMCIRVFVIVYLCVCYYVFVCVCSCALVCVCVYVCVRVLVLSLITFNDQTP